MAAQAAGGRNESSCGGREYTRPRDGSSGVANNVDDGQGELCAIGTKRNFYEVKGRKNDDGSAFVQ